MTDNCHYSLVILLQFLRACMVPIQALDLTGEMPLGNGLQILAGCLDTGAGRCVDGELLENLVLAWVVGLVVVLLEGL